MQHNWVCIDPNDECSYKLVENVKYTSNRNESGTSKRYLGAVYNAMGRMAGMTDLTILYPQGKTAYIEIKTPKRYKTKNNGLEDSQIRFKNYCNDYGFPWAVVCNIEQVISFLSEHNIIQVDRG